MDIDNVVFQITSVTDFNTDGVDIINNSCHVFRVIGLMNIDPTWNDDTIINMAHCVIEPKRGMPRINHRPYVIGDYGHLNIQSLCNIARIVIYNPDYDRYILLEQGINQVHTCSTTN